jgi:hypothetical protein
MDPLHHIIGILGLKQEFRATESVQAQNVFLLGVVIGNVNLAASHVHCAACGLLFTETVSHIQWCLQQNWQIGNTNTR